MISETRTNQLFVTDIPSKLEEIQALIAKIDIPVRQVLIEARIVEADDTFGRVARRQARCARPARHTRRHSGLRRSAATACRCRRQLLNGVGEQTGQAVVTAALHSPTRSSSTCRPPALGGFDAGDLRAVAVQRVGEPLPEPGDLGAGGRRQGQDRLQPARVTADQIKALIEQGEELPYQVATSSGATSMQFRKANLKLEVTPQITPEGNVILDVDVNKDSVGRDTAAGFAINTKHVKTQVLVENGGTVVIGGIFDAERAR